MFVDGLNEKPLKSLPAKPLSWSIPLLGQPLEMHYLDTLTSMASEMMSHQCRLLSICGQILFLSVARWTEFVKDRHLGGGVGIREEREVTYDHRENPSFSPSLPPFPPYDCTLLQPRTWRQRDTRDVTWTLDAQPRQGEAIEDLREGTAELGPGDWPLHILARRSCLLPLGPLTCTLAWNTESKSFTGQASSHGHFLFSGPRQEGWPDRS